MNDVNPLLVLGMMLTVIALGLASVILFWFIPNRLGILEQRISKQFMLYFSFAALAFVSYLVFPSWMPEVVTVLMNTLCYTVAIYMLRQGLLIRKHHTVKPLLQNPIFIANIVFTILVQYLCFSIYKDDLSIRLTVLNINMIALYLSCLPLVSDKQGGEAVVYHTIWFSTILLFTLCCTLFIDKLVGFYAFFVMSAQTILFLVWLGVLFGLLLADSIQRHYQNSVTDAMTGLNNRRYFVEETISQLQHIKKGLTKAQTPTANLIICDIDNFKKINDTYGHSVGDQVICHVANILKQVTRKDDVVARIGGEEFAIYLPNTSSEDASTTAKRLQRLTHELPCGEVFFTVSSGISSGKITPHIDIHSLFDALMREADRALYQAKHDGRDKVCVVQPDGHILTMHTV